MYLTGLLTKAMIYHIFKNCIQVSFFTLLLLLIGNKATAQTTVAMDDIVFVNTLNPTLISVLDNDTITGIERLELIDEPAYGTATLDDSGFFISYEPNPIFLGATIFSDTLTYGLFSVLDSALIDTANVYILWGDNPAFCFADFYYSVDGQTVSFNNSTFSFVENWYWDFGDGFIATDPNPVHTYDSLGIYTACLTITTFDGCINTFCAPIELIDSTACNAFFFVLPTDIPVGGIPAYAFIDASSGNPIAWEWTFGDGSLSTEQFPTYTYNEAGVYEVCLTVTNDIGCIDGYCETIFVEDFLFCVAEAAFSTIDLTAFFTDLSVPEAVSWFWTFGDGATSTLQHPIHTYSSAGLYPVCLFILTADGCTNEMCFDLQISDCFNECVWPGDANNDGIANVWDVLAIGLTYGEVGPPRDLALLPVPMAEIWMGQSAQNWGDTLYTDIDHKFHDCNGDGLIDSSDVSVIDLNYGLTHGKNEGEAATEAQLNVFLEILNTSIGPSDTVTTLIHLADTTGAAVEVYGLAFNLLYPESLIDSSTVNISFGDSWIGNTDSTISLVKNHLNGTVDAAISRISHENTMGSGMFGIMTFVMEDVLIGKTESFELGLAISNVELLTHNGESVTVGAVGDTVAIVTSVTPTPPPTAGFKISPNPATYQCLLDFTGSEAHSIQVFNSTGQMMTTMRIENGVQKMLLPVDAYPSGIYFLNVHTPKGVVTEKLVVVGRK